MKDENIDISSEISAINSLLLNKKSTEALDAVLKLKNRLDEIPSELSRCEALAEFGLGHYDDALDSMKKAVLTSEEISDWHLAGEYSLLLGEIAGAVKYLSKAIKLSENQRTDYYLSTCYLERAFAYIKLGGFDEARQDIEKVNSNESVTWLKGIEPLTKDSLLSMVESGNREI